MRSPYLLYCQDLWDRSVAKQLLSGVAANVSMTANIWQQIRR